MNRNSNFGKKRKNIYPRGKITCRKSWHFQNKTNCTKYNVVDENHKIEKKDKKNSENPVP